MIKKRKNINEVVNETIEQFHVNVKCNLGERLADLGLTIRELSLLTGIRYASVNELVNNKKVTLNLQHLLAIMVALRITSFDELFELEFDFTEEKERFISEGEEYKKVGLPDSEIRKIKENAIRLEREDELKKK